MIKIYHNRQCSKSRQALAILQESTSDLVIQEYLEQIPTREELRELLTLLGLRPLELIRQNEIIFKENFKDKVFTDEQWIEVMLTYPILIERPIIRKDDNVVIGRPIENVLKLL